MHLGHRSNWEGGIGDAIEGSRPRWFVWEHILLVECVEAEISPLS